MASEGSELCNIAMQQWPFSKRHQKMMLHGFYVDHTLEKQQYTQIYVRRYKANEQIKRQNIHNILGDFLQFYKLLCTLFLKCCSHALQDTVM